MAQESDEGGGSSPEIGGANTAAIATALQMGDHDPALTGHIASFFEAQSRLTDAQAHHLHVQLARTRLGTAGDAFKVALQGATLVVVLSVVLLLGWIVRDATHDYTLTIETISVPPSLAARGYTAATVAEALRGKIDAVRKVANANSAGETADVHNGRDEGLKVEIPETGLSLDQVQRFLHGYFGHSRILTGAVTDLSGDRIGLDLQVSGADPVTIEGDRHAVDAMLQKGAEAAFGTFDRFNFVLYLAATGREDDALAFAKRNIAAARTTQELADSLSLAGDIDGDPHAQLARGAAAMEVDPTFWGVWEDTSAGSLRLGHDENALRYFRGLATVRKEDQPRDHQPNFSAIHWRAQYMLSRMVGDYAAELHEVSNAVPRSVGNQSRLTLSIMPLVELHDCAGAENRLWLATEIMAVTPYADAKARHDIARCRGDTFSAVAIARQILAMDVARAGTGQQQTRGTALSSIAVIDRPRLAEDLIDAGQPNEAATILRTTPNDCYRCERLRGRVDAARGDTRNGDIRFANAIHQAPSLPFAYTDWAAAKLARYDVAGALRLADAALIRSPNYPEASALKGDIETALGNRSAALAAYRRARTLAPAWNIVQNKSAGSAKR